MRPRLFAAEIGALSNSLWTKAFSAALRAVFDFQTVPRLAQCGHAPSEFDSFRFSKNFRLRERSPGFRAPQERSRQPRQKNYTIIASRSIDSKGFPRLMTLNFTPSAGPRSSITM